jgi:hypothetical protein
MNPKITKSWSLPLRKASHSESKRYLRVPCDTAGKITGSGRLDLSIRLTFPFEGRRGFSLSNASIGIVEFRSKQYSRCKVVLMTFSQHSVSRWRVQ